MGKISEQMIKQYEVAHWQYQVIFAEGGKNGPELLPSSEPFLVPVDDEKVGFRLYVDDTFRPAHRGEEIGQFDCGGNNHGVYQSEDGKYQIQISDVYGRQCALIEATADFSEAHVALNGDQRGRAFGLNNTLMMVFAFAFADRDTVLMHASVVRKDGYGYPFLGVSGTGKSTHTSNWMRYIDGCDLLNDDNPALRIIDGKAIIYGTPWSGKTPCYRKEEAPVGAFVQLKQAPHNKIRRQTVIEAFASLLPSCSVMKWDARDYGGVCTTMQKIIETVPTYYLENLPDEAAVQLSYSTIRAV